MVRTCFGVKELPEWETCTDDGYAESQVRRVKNNGYGSTARAEPACMRLHEMRGRDRCLEQKIMGECEEEESNVIVMGSFLVESIGEIAAEP